MSTRRWLGRLGHTVIYDRWFPCLYYVLVHMTKGAGGYQYYPYHVVMKTQRVGSRNHPLALTFMQSPQGDKAHLGLTLESQGS